MEFLNNSKELSKVKELMDRLNLGDDPKWLAIVLFVRNLVQELNVFAQHDKVSIQQEIFHNLTGQRPTERQYQAVLAQLDEFIAGNKVTGELRDALEMEQKNANLLLKEMSTIFDSVRGNQRTNVDRLDKFRDKTFDAIKVCKTKSSIMGEVRTMFNELMKEVQDEAQELEAKTRQLELRANIDPLLSQLHNRRALDSYLNRAVASTTNSKNALSFLLLDVDHFKMVNDTHGHQIGDEVLIGLADIMAKRAAAVSGFPARYGGEELSLAIEGLSINAAVLEAETIRATVENHPFVVSGPNGGPKTDQLNITVSIGVAELEQGWSAGDLVKAADKALYRAKSSGRNAVSYHGHGEE